MQLLSGISDTAYYASAVNSTFGNSPEFTAGVVCVAGATSPGASVALLNCFDGATNDGWILACTVQATGAADLGLTLGDGPGVLAFATTSPYQFLGRLLFIALTVTATRASLYVNGQIAAAANFATGYTGTTARGLSIGNFNSGAPAPVGWRYFGAAFAPFAATPSDIVTTWEAISQSEQMVRAVDFEGGLTEFPFSWDISGLQDPGSNLAADTWTARAGGVDLPFGGGGAQQPLITYPNPVWA